MGHVKGLLVQRFGDFAGSRWQQRCALTDAQLTAQLTVWLMLTADQQLCWVAD